MKAAEWIDKVKSQRGWESDYKVAHELGIERNAVSAMRRNKAATLSENTAIAVATALGERPEAVLLDQYAERTHNPAVRSALSEAARRLCILCKVPAALELLRKAARAQGLQLAF